MSMYLSRSAAIITLNATLLTFPLLQWTTTEGEVSVCSLGV